MKNKIIKLVKSLRGFPIIVLVIVVEIILGIAFGFEKTSVILMTVGLVSLVLIAIIVSIYVLHANFRPLDLSGLSKELEYFEIKKDIKKDIKIGWSSKEHYVFLYNSLSEHICELDNRPAQISFLNAKIYNSELISNGSNSVNFLKLISVFFSFFSGYGLKDLLNSGDVSLAMAFAYLIITAIIAVFLWIHHIFYEKPKHSFYLSVLNQFKDDFNRGLTEVDNSNALDQSEGNPTANLPDADDDNADNGSADNSSADNGNADNNSADNGNADNSNADNNSADNGNYPQPSA